MGLHVIPLRSRGLIGAARWPAAGSPHVGGLLDSPHGCRFAGLHRAGAGAARGARRGQDYAFGRLVGPYWPELHAHCYRMLGSVHDADDALRDTLLRAWRGLPGFDGRRSLRPWLFKIAN